MLTSLERRLDCLTINEFADMSERNSPEMLSMLFGGEPRRTSPHLSGIGQGAGLAYGSSLRRLAKELSLPLDEVTVSANVATAKNPVQTAVGTIEAGTVAAWRIEVSGVRAGKPLLQMIPTWYLTPTSNRRGTFPFQGRDGTSLSMVTRRSTSRSASHGLHRQKGPVTATATRTVP